MREQKSSAGGIKFQVVKVSEEAVRDQNPCFFGWLVNSPSVSVTQ
jgi:hypothetical protein